MIPHSHDDVGWRKTIDSYYDGTKRNTQWTSVDVELSSIVASLLENPARKFSEVEMKFFSMWFYSQDEATKENVRTLVANGQLELINGGWSMHDEACPSYTDMINNMMLGHDFILKEFGVKPRIGWQIDPFGHSNANARLFAEMGFDAWFFSRIDFKDKERRLEAQEMEWIWYPNKWAEEASIFTHALFPSIYFSPVGLRFDMVAKRKNGQS